MGRFNDRFNGNRRQDNYQRRDNRDRYNNNRGDNRDNSVDSRFAETGLVPEENLIGKARIIFFSINDNLLKFWKWHKILRFNRMFTKIK